MAPASLHCFNTVLQRLVASLYKSLPRFDDISFDLEEKKYYNPLILKGFSGGQPRWTASGQGRLIGGFMRELYIDFDGVILDTEEELFREWRKNLQHHSLPEKYKSKPP